MSRIFMIGFEIPGLNAEMLPLAMNYRTWQVTKPLLDDGHEIYLCARVNRSGQPVGMTESIRIGKLTYDRVDFNQAGWVSSVNRRLNAFKPDCVVAVSFLCSVYATRLRTDRPMWMDIYGENLSENQLSMAAQKSDRGYLASRWFDQAVLRRGDMFSACSLPQKYALVGRLAALGRLSRHTLGYDFVQTVLPGILPSWEGVQQSTPPGLQPALLRGKIIQPEDFAVLWCGSYNTWVDFDVLFNGLTAAMQQNPKIVYVSVGSYTVNAEAYQRFEDQINQSPFRERFKLLGHRPFSETLSLYRESNCGISVDREVYEARLGTRTRLVDMAAAGLPVVTSDACELSQLMGEAKAALTFPVGDSRAFSDRLLRLSREPELRHQLAERGKSFVEQRLSARTTAKLLLDWVRQPACAPDRGFRVGPPDWFRYWARLALWKIGGQVGKSKKSVP